MPEAPSMREVLGRNPAMSRGKRGPNDELGGPNYRNARDALLLTKIAWLDVLDEACAADDRWTSVYSAALLKVVSGTGAFVDPFAIR